MAKINFMYAILKTIHGQLPFLLLAALSVAVVIFSLKLIQKGPFAKADKSLALITLIFTHVQLLLGIILYFVSPLVKEALNSGEMMSNAAHRFNAIEHGLTMIFAIVLITAGYSKSKKKTEDAAKFKTLVIFYGLGLILALSRIPWNTWLS